MYQKAQEPKGDQSFKIYIFNQTNTQEHTSSSFHQSEEDTKTDSAGIVMEERWEWVEVRRLLVAHTACCAHVPLRPCGVPFIPPLLQDANPRQPASWKARETFQSDRGLVASAQVSASY
jgi:hypothetical protein